MFHNLLAAEKKKSLRIEYYTRLATVACFVFAGAVLSGSVALLPTYLQLRTTLNFLQEDAARYETEDAVAVAEPFERLGESAVLLERMELVASEEGVGDIVRAALSSRPEGIAIVGFSYDRDTSLITLEGVAETRSALVSFTRTLGEHERFTSVTNPIADLAISRDLPFRISCTLVDTT